MKEILACITPSGIATGLIVVAITGIITLIYRWVNRTKTDIQSRYDDIEKLRETLLSSASESEKIKQKHYLVSRSMLFALALIVRAIGALFGTLLVLSGAIISTVCVINNDSWIFLILSILIYSMLCWCIGMLEKLLWQPIKLCENLYKVLEEIPTEEKSKR